MHSRTGSIRFNRDTGEQRGVMGTPVPTPQNRHVYHKVDRLRHTLLELSQ